MRDLFLKNSPHETMSPYQLTAGRTAAVVLVSTGLGLAGCFNSFALSTDTDTGSEDETDTVVDTDTSDSGLDTGDDFATDRDTGTGSGRDTGSDPQIHCPEGIELTSPIEYTAVSSTDKDGTEYIDTCPSGQIIVGFEGFLIEYGVGYPMAHGRFRAICGIPSIHLVGDACAVEMNTGEKLPVRGIGGTLEWSQVCPDNEAVIGFKAWTGHDVVQLVFRCAPLVIADDGNRYTIELGAHRDMEPVGDTKDGVVDFQHDCPEGQVATTTKLKSNHLMRAFSLGCQAPFGIE